MIIHKDVSNGADKFAVLDDSKFLLNAKKSHRISTISLYYRTLIFIDCVILGPTYYSDLLLPEPAKVIKVNMINIIPITEIVPTLMSLPDDTILGNIIPIVINAPIHKIANIAFVS